MALPSYPSALPNPLAPNYSFAFGDGRFRSQNDAGPRNMRRRYSAVPSRVDFATQLSRMHLGIFEAFFVADTKEGSLPFLVADHKTDGYPVLDEDGNTMLYEDGTVVLYAETLVARFDGMPVITNKDSNIWVVSFSLEVMPS